MIVVMSNSATAENTKDPATDLIRVELFQSYPWKYLFINSLKGGPVTLENG